MVLDIDLQEMEKMFLILNPIPGAWQFISVTVDNTGHINVYKWRISWLK